MLHINNTQIVVQCSSHNTEPLTSQLNAQWEVWLQMSVIYTRKAIKFHPLNLTLGIHLIERALGTKKLTPYVDKITMDHYCGF